MTFMILQIAFDGIVAITFVLILGEIAGRWRK